MTATMQFEKRNFMGVELDVLTGHPGHELLFIATQVARAAGLKNPSSTVGSFKVSKACAMHRTLGDTIEPYNNLVGSVPKAASGRAYTANTALLNESMVYQMLLRSHAPASEPFRKWVTEEVLPTIRKTGRYDAEESTNPIAVGVIDELKTLRQEIAERDQRHSLEIAELKALLVGMSLTAPLHSIAPPSPYIGTEATTVPFHYQKALGRELMDLAGLNTPAADKATPRVVVALEEIVKKLWDEEDGRHLESAMGDCPITVPTDPAGRCFKGITALSTTCFL